MAKPAYRAYTVIKREDKDDFWLNLGVAFPHDAAARTLIEVVKARRQRWRASFDVVAWPRGRTTTNYSMAILSGDHRAASTISLID